MKLIRTAATLPLVVTLFLAPQLVHAQMLASEAPAVVVLTKPVDAQKMAPGTNIDTKLTNTVHLPNGTTIPSGTHLLATITQDSSSDYTGKTRLAIRFTSAAMKNGQTMPIKATILSIATDAVPTAGNGDVSEVDLPVPDNLRNQPDRVDAVGVTKDVDLHSNASSDNSGVFVTMKDNIKLPRNTKIAIALAPGM